MRLEIVADVVCPWCFIGKRRLERALAMRPGVEIELSWRAFQLNPDMPPDGMPRDRYLQLKFGARNSERALAALAAAGRAEGIAFAFDRIRRAPNTLRAHQLIRLAGEIGCEEAVVEFLFSAYFVEGQDIGDTNVLVDIGRECGLDPAATRRALGRDTALQEARAENNRARRLGINAVPCFVFDGGYAISGAQEPEMFLPLFDLASQAASRGVADAIAQRA